MPAERVTYIRRYNIWVGEKSGGGKWEEYDTAAEVGRRIEELLVAGKGRDHRLSVSVTDKAENG